MQADSTSLLASQQALNAFVTFGPLAEVTHGAGTTTLPSPLDAVEVHPWLAAVAPIQVSAAALISHAFAPSTNAVAIERAFSHGGGQSLAAAAKSTGRELIDPSSFAPRNPSRATGVAELITGSKLRARVGCAAPEVRLGDVGVWPARSQPDNSLGSLVGEALRASWYSPVGGGATFDP